MTKKELSGQILKKKSFLCIGLDSDIEKIPKHLLKYDDPVFEFNRQIIDATQDLCIAYKPNTAFYECRGKSGWESLEKTIGHLPENIFSIADAKRGDIGNTSALYAKTFFTHMDCDAVTVNPLMGEDSVKPFLTYDNKWAILLGLTSNKSAEDFQLSMTAMNPLEKESEEMRQIPLFEKIISVSSHWGTDENMMYVIGATKAEQIERVRKIIPEHFLLVPGIGAQGGDLLSVCRHGMNSSYGLIINVSRSILYVSDKTDFADQARSAAKAFQKQMQEIIEKSSGQ